MVCLLIGDNYNSRKILVKVGIKSIIFLLIFWFVGSRLYQNLSKLEQRAFEPSWFLAGISFLFFLFYFLVIMEAWRLLVVNLGFPMNRRTAFRIWFSANMGKYLPGKFWFILGRYEISRKAKVPLKITTASIFLEMVLLLVSGTLLFLFCQPWIGNFPISPFILGVALIGGFGLIHPSFLNAVLLFFKKEGETLFVSISYLVVLGIMFYYIVAWAAYGFGCWLLGISLCVDINLFVFLGVFPFSWVVGYLVIITPGGLGVREEMSVFLLADTIGKPPATLITIAARLFWMLAETICFLLARKIRG